MLPSSSFHSPSHITSLHRDATRSAGVVCMHGLRTGANISDRNPNEGLVAVP